MPGPGAGLAVAVGGTVYVEGWEPVIVGFKVESLEWAGGYPAAYGPPRRRTD